MLKTAQLEKIVSSVLDSYNEWLKKVKEQGISEQEAKTTLNNYNSNKNLNDKEQIIIDLAEKYNIISD